MSIETLLNTGFKLLNQHADLLGIDKAFSFISYPSDQVDVFFTDEHSTRRIALITPARLTDGTVWFEGESHWYQISTTPNGYYVARLPFERILEALIGYYRTGGDWNHLPINPHIDVHDPVEPEKTILRLKGVACHHQHNVDGNILTLGIIKPTKEAIEHINSLPAFCKFDEIQIGETYQEGHLHVLHFSPGKTFLKAYHTDESKQTITLLFLNDSK